MLVYFSSVSENTHRFVQKLGLPAARIPLHGRIEVDEPNVLSGEPGLLPQLTPHGVLG